MEHWSCYTKAAFIYIRTFTLNILGAAQRRVRESESESERLASEKLSLGMGPAQGLWMSESMLTECCMVHDSVQIAWKQHGPWTRARCFQQEDGGMPKFPSMMPYGRCLAWTLQTNTASMLKDKWLPSDDKPLCRAWSWPLTCPYMLHYPMFLAWSLEFQWDTS